MSIPNSRTNDRISKTCFVAVGATTTFPALIQSVISSSFLTELNKLRYTNLIIQYGEKGDGIFQDCIDNVMIEEKKAIKGIEQELGLSAESAGISTIEIQSGSPKKEILDHKGGHNSIIVNGIHISGFDLDSDGLDSYFQLVKTRNATNKKEKSDEGVIVSHAGRSIRRQYISPSSTITTVFVNT